jgi:DHA2 family multidrug resistance protein
VTHREESGNASALYALVRNEGSSLGVALVTTRLARGTQTHQAYLVGNVTPFSTSAMRMVHQFASLAGGSDPVYAQKFGLMMAYNLVGQQASVLAYLDQFRSFGFLILLIVPLVFLLKKSAVDKNAPTEAVH